MSDLFKEIIPSILKTKKYCLEQESDYVPFIVNRALSYHTDCIFYANEMNINYNVSKKLQYDYYINKIRAKSRPFVPWQKKVKKSDDLQSVKTYYGYSDSKALVALSILSEEQLAEIKTKTKIGD